MQQAQGTSSCCGVPPVATAAEGGDVYFTQLSHHKQDTALSQFSLLLLNLSSYPHVWVIDDEIAVELFLVKEIFLESFYHIFKQWGVAKLYHSRGTNR